jgi:hypothetical protein
MDDEFGLTDEEEEPIFKEMFAADIPRMDLVKGPASGMLFTIMKSNDPQDPLSIALMKRPPQHPSLVAKAEASAATQNDHPDSDFAYIEPGGTKDESGKTTPRSLRHFPIYDAAHTRNALARAPQSPFGDKAMPKIKSAAKKFGIDVSKSQEKLMANPIEAPLAPPVEPVTKADGDPDLDASTIVVEDGSPVDAGTPGSESWENVDAATAQKWTAILGRAKLALEYLADREGQEVAVGESEAADNAWDLEDASSAIDFAIGVLASFAVGETTEAELAADGGVIKAMQTFPLTALETVEGAFAVKKAGRVLSGANEQAIRDAIASLTNVLATLPAAPVEDAVVKAQEVPTLPQTPNEPLIAAYDLSHAPIGVTVASKMLSFDQAKERVTKAKGDPMVACYNANGDLIGVVDPDDLVTTAAGKPAETADAPAPADGDGAQAPTPDEADAAAANAATAAAAPTAPVAPVAKALDNMAETVRKAVADAIEAAEEGHQKVVKSLEDRLVKVETSPAPGGPLLSDRPHGGPESGAHLRDQGAGSNPALELVEKQLAVATDPSERTRLQRLAFLETLKPRYQ